MLKEAIKNEERRWGEALVSGDMSEAMKIRARLHTLEETAAALENARRAIGHLVGRAA